MILPSKENVFLHIHYNTVGSVANGGGISLLHLIDLRSFSLLLFQIELK